MSYKNDVAEARRLAKRSEEGQWRLAELTHAVVEAGTSRRQWAKDVGFSDQHAGRLYRIWESYGATARSHRPPFWDCYAKITQRDPDATNDSRRGDVGLAHATPAAVAELVAERPDVARAIARNTDAIQGVEEAYIEGRGRAELVDRDMPKRVARNVSHALDVDEAVMYLHGAARELANAINVAEEYGVNDTDGEADALRQVRRLLRSYESSASVTDTDRDWLANHGIRIT